MSFLVSLLLPVLAIVLYYRGYPDRAARGLAPVRLTTGAAIRSGAATGAMALVFLAVLGVVILAVRGRMVTPPGVDVSPVAFWVTQFALAAGIGAVVGAVAAVGLLPWVRGRLAHLAPPPHEA